MPQCSHAFEALYGQPPTVEACAPGRVNLIGDHTDYQGGYVLPAALPWAARVALRPRGDATVRAFSANAPFANGVLSYQLGRESKDHDWLDYVKGVTAALRDAGHTVSGFDLYIDSAVPAGAGLSSSAALEVALLRALCEAFALELDAVAIAVLGRRAETDFVGVPIGIMDQMAASLAEPDSALFLDTRSLQFEHVSLPAGLAFVVLGSGIAHGHAQGEYRTRRAESNAAAQSLGVPLLRDATLDAIAGCTALPDTLARRARHVVSENARVLAAVDALRAADGVRLGRLLQQSHASLRDDYQVSIPEVDLLVEIAQTCAGVHGARLTGGGFGGSVVAVVDAGVAHAAGERIAAAYAERSGHAARVLVCNGADARRG